MAVVRYHEYVPALAEELDLGELVDALSDFLLSSGFGGEPADDDLDALHDAILDAVLRRGLLGEDELARLLSSSSQLDQFLDQLVQRLQREGVLSLQRPRDEPTQAPGGRGASSAHARFQLTDKGVDFLGFRALRDVLGTLGRASFGRHDTRDLATGVEASGASKDYEFGDTLNLDVPATLRSALAREGLRVPIPLEYGDLRVHQSEYQSSCATVLLLDCSHSMVLYGA